MNWHLLASTGINRASHWEGRSTRRTSVPWAATSSAPTEFAGGPHGALRPDQEAFCLNRAQRKVQYRPPAGPPIAHEYCPTDHGDPAPETPPTRGRWPAPTGRRMRASGGTGMAVAITVDVYDPPDRTFDEDVDRSASGAR